MTIYLKADNPHSLFQMEKLVASGIDVMGAKEVEVSTNDEGDVLWVNVNGICLLRICKIKNLKLLPLKEGNAD